MWIAVFLSAFFAMAVACALAARINDPLIRFGCDDRPRFWGRGSLMNAGIIRHRDYEAVIIGSSVTQNFDMAFFRRAMGMEPIKLSLGGISVPEMLKFYEMVQARGTAKVIMINIDVTGFDGDYDLDDPWGRLPRFMYEDGALNDLRYCLMYEVWFRFIPVNLALRGILAAGLSYANVSDRVNIDRMDDRGGDFTPSKEKVLANYTKHRAAEKKRPSASAARMKRNIDAFLFRVLGERREGQSVVFAFPPYSVLYWWDAVKDGNFEAIMDAEEFFVERCAGSARVVDMQDIDEIADLDNYGDSVHYGPKVQALYAEALLDGTRDLTPASFPARRARLEELVREAKLD
jgi:hypothetical protein